MPVSDPRAVIARWWSEVWGQGRLDLIDELLADTYVTHSADGPTARAPVGAPLPPAVTSWSPGTQWQ